MRLKIAVLCAAVCTLSVFCGCGATTAAPVQDEMSDTRWVNVYYASAEAGRRDDVIAAEVCEIPRGNLEKTVLEIYRQCLCEPISNSLRSAIPEDTVLENVDIKDGTVTLNLSREYGKISGFTRTVADYCLALSLCELEGVRDVTILVSGEEDSDSVGISQDDIVLADLELVGFRKKLKLYFPDINNTTLALEIRDAVSNGGEEEALLVAKALADGPAQRGNSNVMPYGTRVNSVQMVKGVCILDLSAEFVADKTRSEAAERMCIRSIVETLSEIEGVEQVQIVIDGVKVKGFTYFDLTKPFSRGYI